MRKYTKNSKKMNKELQDIPELTLLSGSCGPSDVRRSGLSNVEELRFVVCCQLR